MQYIVRSFFICSTLFLIVISLANASPSSQKTEQGSWGLPGVSTSGNAYGQKSPEIPTVESAPKSLGENTTASISQIRRKMSFEMIFIVTATILLVISNYLVQRYNKKRRIMQAVAFYLQLLRIGVASEEASGHVLYKMRLSPNEVDKVLEAGRRLEEEALQAKFLIDAERKVFNNN